jgi:transposase-like protein
MSDEIDLNEMRHARSSTDDADRKHCAECGSINISARPGNSFNGRHTDRDARYRCMHCGENVEACRDTPGGCSHD